MSRQQQAKANPDKALKPLAGSVNQYGETIKTGRVRWAYRRSKAAGSFHAVLYGAASMQPPEAFDPEKCRLRQRQDAGVGNAAALPRAGLDFNTPVRSA